jgi:integrase
MACITQRGGKWQARVHRVGMTRSKTFLLKTDAVRWGREQDIQLDRLLEGLLGQSTGESDCPSLGELIVRYKASVTPQKKGAKQEGYKLDGLLRHRLATLRADSIKSTHIAAYRDERLKALAGNTVKNELNLLSAVFHHAEVEWGLPIRNPVKGLKRPTDGARTVRIPDITQVKSLREAAAAIGRADLSTLILLASETGARLGELLSVKSADIDLQLGFIQLGTTKNGEPRVLPLTPMGCKAIWQLLAARECHKLFEHSPDHYKYAFKQLTRRCHLEWATFHSLRHLAVTRMLEAGLSVTEVSAISGHKTVQMLKRYTHHRHTHLRNKLIATLGEQSGSGFL